MILVHHLEHSRSLRILWALEELNLAYDIKSYKRLPNYAAPSELKKVHPLGKAPVITDNGQSIAESAVILEYLQSQYDAQHEFKPKQNPDLLQYQYWMHYAEGSLMPLLVMTLVLSFVPPKVPFLIRPIAKKIVDGLTTEFIQPRLTDHLHFLEQHLQQNDYFAGNFSFADIQMSFPLSAILSRMKGRYPHMQAYLDRIQSRPAYLRAFKRSGDQAL